MNTTKNNILENALELFNRNGISNVSLRNIADKTAISVGNLQYHFKKREDIIEALYFQIVEKIEKIVFINSDDLLESFFNISSEMLFIFFDYRFFLLDFLSVIRNNKKIKDHYSLVSQKRELEFLAITKVLIEKEIFRKELLLDEYHSLYKRTELLSNFWFSSLYIQNKALTQKSIKQYSQLISQSIFPYLTEKAKIQYASIFKSQYKE